jgi:hypothetical protein
MKFKIFFIILLITKLNVFSGPVFTRALTNGIDNTKASQQFVQTTSTGREFLKNNEKLIQFALFGIGFAGVAYGTKTFIDIFKKRNN